MNAIQVGSQARVVRDLIVEKNELDSVYIGKCVVVKEKISISVGIEHMIEIDNLNCEDLSFTIDEIEFI